MPLHLTRPARSFAMLCMLLLLLPSVGQATRSSGAYRELIVAVVQGRPEVVARHLRADPVLATRLLGTPPSEAGSGAGFRETALVIAVRNHQMEVARMLLQAGANPNSDNGRALLESVAFPEMVDLLVASGLDPVRASNDSASLGGALDGRPRQRAIARALIRHGVSCELEDAVRLGLLDRVESCCQREGAAPHTALLYRAIETAQPGLVAMLLQHGCRIDGPPPPSPYHNWTYPPAVAQFALFDGRVEDAILLLDAGAPISSALDGWDSRPGLQDGNPQLRETEQGDLLDRALDLGSDALYDKLVARGLDPTARHSPRRTTCPVLPDRLARAAWRGDGALVDRLILAAQLAAVEVDLAAVALAAAAAGHAALANELMDRAGVVSPHALAALGQAEALDAWLDVHPADLERLDPRCGATPLAWAVFAGETQTARRLLSRGANAHVRVHTQVLWAQWTGAMGTTMPRRGESDQEVALVELPVQRGELELTSHLVRAGARLDWIALWLLAENSAARATEVLADALRLGRIDAGDRDWGKQALAVLAPSLHSDGTSEERWRLLIDAGAADFIRESTDPARLDHLYAAGAPPEILAELGGNGASVNEPVAITLGLLDDEAVHAYVNGLTDRDWQSALERAGRQARHSVYSQLFRARESVSHQQVLDLIHHAAYWGDFEVIDIAAERAPPGYDILNDSDLFENGSDNESFIDELIKRGADPYQANGSGRGPLHRAAYDAQIESVRSLLSAGAVVDLRSTQGRTPLHELRLPIDAMRATNPPEQSLLDTIAALLEAGADPLSVDDRGSVVFERLLRADWTEDGRRRLRELLVGRVDPTWL
jgi:ankyrin repeat protein